MSGFTGIGDKIETQEEPPMPITPTYIVNDQPTPKVRGQADRDALDFTYSRLNHV
jgi:hypothetical protein